MATILPVGLTYLLPSTGTTVELTPAEIISSSGKVGPVTLKLTNSSDANVAVVSYSNDFVPPAPVTYTNITLTSNYGSITVDITVDPADYIPVATVTNGGSGQYTNITFSGAGQNFGGETALVYFNCTGTNNGAGPGAVTTLEYTSGYVPAGGSAVLPTEGNPTKVFTVTPLASEIVQIPSSDSGTVTLFASGADVYVTPVQIVA